MVKDDIILTNGEYIIDHEAKDWLDQVCRTIKDAVGNHPKMRMYPYRKDRCNYLAVDFDEHNTDASGRPRKWFSLTIAIAPCGKVTLDRPEIGCNDLVPTIRDSFDAITIVAHLASRLRAEVAFNLPLSIAEP
ncbi:hypothetical protein [Acidithiobacillus sp.]|uniref:hypothetical protein n=1 Tax=Acidithiobacillus sp. TaxID=1872118 RepID=UPI003D0142D0